LPPVSSSTNFKMIAIVLGVALVLAIAGIVIQVQSTPAAAPTVTVTTTFPVDPEPTVDAPSGLLTPVFDVPVGSCFSMQYLKDTGYADVWLVPCTELHDAEAIFVGDMPHTSGPKPESDQWKEWAYEHCDPAFEDYIGLHPTKSVHHMAWIYPSDAEWDRGISTIFCLIEGDKAQTGSYRDSNR